MQGKLNKTQIDELLHKQIVGRIGCHANGRTYIVPISYACDEDYVYAHTYAGLKIEIMRTNPNVCFEVEQMDNMANWKTVIAQGIYEELTEPAVRQIAIDKLMKRNFPFPSSSTVKFSKHWPFSPENEAEVGGIFFRIQLTDKQGRYEKSCNNESRCTGNCRVKRISSLKELMAE